MVVIVIMAAGGAHIGAAFRVERRFDRDHGRAESARHVLDHRIAADAQAPFRQLGRQVAIAEVPGDAGQRGGIGGADFGERLRRGDDLDDAAVLELQSVAGAQHHRFRQVEQEAEPAHAGHGEAAAIALVVIEHHRVDRLARPLSGGNDGMSVEHGASQEGGGQWAAGSRTICRLRLPTAYCLLPQKTPAGL